MRWAFGLAGVLVTIGVIAWIMAKVELPETQQAIKVQDEAKVMTDQISGRDASGVDVGNTYSDYADTRDDGKLLDIQITQLAPASAMATRFGLQTNDVVVAAIDGHGVRTDLNGLNSEEEGKDAIREAYGPVGQLVVKRGTQELTLPVANTPPQNPVVANNTQQNQQMQQNAQKTEKQQEGKSNDGSENGTMDELHQRLHALPTY